MERIPVERFEVNEGALYVAFLLGPVFLVVVLSGVVTGKLWKPGSLTRPVFFCS